jgi:hypothetical protein
VGEKNGGANANQERNKERHVNVPHSGWRKFREFLFQKRFAAPTKRFRHRPPGASAPRFHFGRLKGRILKRWQRNLFAKDTPAPIPLNDRQQNLSANSCLGLRPTTSFFYCLSVTRCLQAMIGIEFGAVFDISQLNYECRHLLLAPSLKLSAELGIDLAWGIPPRRAIEGIASRHCSPQSPDSPAAFLSPGGHPSPIA